MIALHECLHCGEPKPDTEDNFYREPRNRRRGRMAHCKDCHAIKNRRSAIKRNYGISEDQRSELLESQGNACAICGTPETECRGARLHVDHDHASGGVRGLLCENCNRGLGMFKDRPARLLAALTYLYDR